MCALFGVVYASPIQKCRETLGILANEGLQISVAQYDLQLRRPILSASGTIPVHTRQYVKVTDPAGNSGYGESAPHPVYGPSVDALKLQIQSAMNDGSLNLTETHGLTMAALDLAAKREGKPLWEFLGLPPPSENVTTAVTFGGDSFQSVAGDIQSERPRIIKLKLNGHHGEIDLVKQVAGSFEQALILDVNGNWSAAQAQQHLESLKPLQNRILWVEQPLPAQTRGQLITEIPLVADESVGVRPITPAEFQGASIKPARLGLIRSLELVAEFNQKRLFITFGCHLQCGLTTGASLQLNSVSQAVDLDSSFLLKNDPFDGVVDSHQNQLNLSNIAAPGIGGSPTVDIRWEEITPQ